MKNLKVIVVVIMGLLFFSCDDEDRREFANDVDDIFHNLLVGDWKLNMKKTENGEVPLSNCERNSVLQLNSNKTFRLTHFDQDPDNDNECGQESITEGNWSINSGITIDDIVYKFSFGDTERTILILNATDGNPNDSEPVITIVYTKINN